MTLNAQFQVKFQFYDDDPIPTDGYAFDDVQVRAPHVPTPASFPYYSGFESGALGDEWLIAFTNEGRVRVDTYHPYTGTHSLLLDDWQNDAIWSTAAAILTIDLSGQSQVELDFWWDEFGTADDTQDGVFISDDTGATWHRILSFDADPTAWRHEIIDLDAAATANGLTLNAHFQIKFQFYDDDPIPTDGYAFDDVQVRAPHVPTPASFPYYSGFESGALGNEWLIAFTNEGRVRVDTYHPYTGTHSLLLDDWQNDAIWSTAAAILTIDLSGQAQVELDFWWDEFGTADDTQDGVFISDDTGATWYRILSFDADPTAWRHEIIDLDAAATANGLTLNAHFQVKFQFYDDDPIPTDGYAFDDVQVRAPHVPTPASFPYYSGFESGALGNEWLIAFTNEGRVRVDTYHPYTGTHSLLLDDWQNDAIWSTVAAILAIDLSGQAQVELDFWWDEFGTADDTQDGVFISDDTGATWYRILSFDADPTAWRHEIIDLDAAATANGLTLNAHFQVKFQFYDDDPIPTDGYAFDDVQVRANAAPTLGWAGDANYQQDGLHPESGDVRDDYFYRIKYADVDGDTPAFVRTHIQKGGEDIAGNPFTMTCASGDPAVGMLCIYTQAGLQAGADYTYFFTAQDDQGNAATPTTPLDAPDVTITYRLYLPVTMKDAGPPAGAPVLNPIDNPSGDYQFTVSWSAVARATRYTLEEDDNTAFASPSTVYAGSALSRSVSVGAVGTYYYRVKASNTLGESGWSNAQSVVVTVAPPPCPQAGAWSGITAEGTVIRFTVADTPGCAVTYLKIASKMDCIYPTWSFLYTVEYNITRPIVNREFQYYFPYDPNKHVEKVTGSFTSETQANGDSFFMLPNPQNTASFCIGGPQWTASHGQ